MGLFAKQPIRLSQNIPYTVALNGQIKLIVGLGNPESKYKNTRHNVGFSAIDYFASVNNFPNWQENKRFKGHFAEYNLGSSRIILFKPNTYMNLSGEAVQAISSFYRIDSSDITTIHDELSLNFGCIRSRTGGSSAGHNGISSIIEHIGPNFGRIRIGIKNNQSDITETSSFVLSNFTKDEQVVLPKIFKETVSILTEYIYSGNLPSQTINI